MLNKLYEDFFHQTKTKSESSKKLLKIINSVDHNDTADDIYNFMNVMDDEDYNAWIHLDELLHTKMDFKKCSTIEFREFLLAMEILDAPQTTFIQKEGMIKRDPGTFKSWRDTIWILTTEGFLHGFILKTDKEPIFSINCRKIRMGVRKDTRFEIVESRKGFFSSSKKFIFKCASIIEMEEWMKAIKEFVPTEEKD